MYKVLDKEPKLISKSNKLPLHKYLYNAKKEYPDLMEQAITFDLTLYSNTIKKNRKRYNGKNIKDILENIEENKQLEYITHLEEDELDIDDLEEYLLIKINEKVFERNEKITLTNIRRLIRIYDYKKYSKLNYLKYNKTRKQLI